MTGCMEMQRSTLSENELAQLIHGRSKVGQNALPSVVPLGLRQHWIKPDLGEGRPLHVFHKDISAAKDPGQ